MGFGSSFFFGLLRCVWLFCLCVHGFGTGDLVRWVRVPAWVVYRILSVFLRFISCVVIYGSFMFRSIFDLSWLGLGGWLLVLFFFLKGVLFGCI